MRIPRVSLIALALAAAAAVELHRPGAAGAQAAADLLITKTTPVSVADRGATITYTVTVASGGPSGAQGVVLTDDVPATTTFQSLASPPGWVCQTPPVGSAGRVTCGLPALAAIEGPQAFTLVVRVNPDAPPGALILNTAEVGARTFDPVTANNVATAQTTVADSADVGVTKTAAGPALPGTEVAYTITVTNGGPSAAQQVALADAVPAGTSFVSLDAPAAWTCTTPAAGGTGGIACTRDTLPAGAGPQTFTLVVRVEAGTAASAALVNTASVSAATPDPVSANNAAGATARVGARRLVVGAGAGAAALVRSLDPVAVQERTSFVAFPGFTGGVRVALGDVNGDGVPDMIAGRGPGGAPEVRVFDGMSGDLLRSFFAYDAGFAGGVFVGAGDVDGDGFDDIVTGADAGSGPHVKVFSGATGAELRSFFAYAPDLTGGVRVAAGDVDGDGLADIVTGAGAGAGPHVKVFSGATGAELRSFFAYAPGFVGGVYVAAGDVDGDGLADIVTGAGAGAGPHVKVFSGVSGAELRSFFAFGPGGGGGVRVAAGDVNRDGIVDLVAGAERDSSLVGAFDGKTLAPLASFFALDGSPAGGVFVAANPVAAPEQVQITSPARGTSVRRGTLLTLSWQALDGATAYGVEVSGVGRQFANRRGSGPDPVNGFGGAGTGFFVLGTELPVLIPPGLTPGTYEVRVIAFGPLGLLGRFGDAVPITIEP